MAKIHVNQYFLEVQNQYLEMLDNLKDFKELAAEGKISEQEYFNMLNEIELLKSNYERIAYIIMLLNKPKSKKAKEDKTTLSWYTYLQGSSKEAILDENRDVLADMKKLIREGKL